MLECFRLAAQDLLPFNIFKCLKRGLNAEGENMDDLPTSGNCHNSF